MIGYFKILNKARCLYLSDNIQVSEAKSQIIQMAKRCAMLYQSFSRVLVKELGEAEGTVLIDKAIADYGTQCGLKCKSYLDDLGLANSIENFPKAPDLPKIAWCMEGVLSEDNELHVEISYCPLAEYWMSQEFSELGRRYCFVDQSKITAYNPDLECVHLMNMLDGQNKCHLLIRRKDSIK